MNKKTTINEIMTRTVVVGNSLNTLTQLLEFFRTYKIQHLPICEGDKLVGIVSLHDIMDYMSNQVLMSQDVNCNSLKHNFNINKVMTSNPVTVSTTDSVLHAVEILGKANFQSLPVVENGKLVGLVTNKDIVKFFAHEVTPNKKGFSLNFNLF